MRKLIGWWVLAAWFSGAGAEPLPDDLECLIEPSREVDISSAVPGIVESIRVERGAEVRSGEVLVKLKSGMEQAAVNLARAKVEFGRRRVERNRDLHEQQMISIHEKDEMETELRISQLELEEAEERLKLRTVRSPLSGVVVERHVAEGEFVGEEPVLSIASIAPLHVEVVVPAEQLGSIKNDSVARVFPQPPVGGEYKARVTIVDQVVDAASGTFRVRLVIPNRSKRLPAGLKCRVRFGESP